MLTRLFKPKEQPSYEKKLGTPMTYETLFDRKIQVAFEQSYAKDKEGVIKFLIAMHRKNMECECSDLDTDKGTVALLNDLISFNYLVKQPVFGMVHDTTSGKPNSVFFRI